MGTQDLIEDLKACLNEIPQLREIRKGFHHPKVKSWKTRLEGLLVEGGHACSKTLEAVRKMNYMLSGSDFIREQTYRTQMDSLKNSLSQCIQTIQLFGRPEDKIVDIAWAKPKTDPILDGYLKIGESKVAAAEVSIHEVLEVLLAFVKDSNDLTDDMKDNLSEHLDFMIQSQLFEPFLNNKLDRLFAYWVQIQDK